MSSGEVKLMNDPGQTTSSNDERTVIATDYRINKSQTHRVQNSADRFRATINTPDIQVTRVNKCLHT